MKSRLSALDYFDHEEVERARRYHRPVYVAFLAETVLGLGVLAVLAVSRPDPGIRWWLEAPALAALTVLCSTLVRLPVSFWRGYVHERRFGLSTQTLRGWWIDRAKGLAVGLVVTSAVMTGLVGLVRALPVWWPVAAGAGAALFTLLVGFVAPVVLEPLFNRFEPLLEEPLAAELRQLAERAGVPVSAVLVADASRRTEKANAYVSGLGRTRRVVVWDTLLRSSGPREVELVVAHELGHRRERHVAKLTALAIVGGILFVLALRVVLGDDVAQPAAIPRVMLLGTILELLALPFSNALIRRWERVADRVSLELTGDHEAFAKAHVALARRNLSDLDPPRALYLLLFSHPTPPERLASAMPQDGA
jgi:STE24 endopeptidase